MIKYILLWFPMLALAVLNGALRDLVYKKYIGELTAHQVSTILLISLFTLYIAFVMYRFPAQSAAQAWLVGLLWMILTLTFELGFGRARGNTWQHLLADYNIISGRIWMLVPLWLLVTPYIFYRVWRVDG